MTINDQGLVTMPISAAKRRANIENSRKSTGPRTTAGKHAVRHNSVTHGATAKTPVLPWESQALFDRQVIGVKMSIRPVGVLEHSLCDQIALANWQLARGIRSDIARVTSNVENADAGNRQMAADLAVSLGQKLFFHQHGPIALYPRSRSDANRPRTVQSKTTDDPDHPSRLIMALEATAAGAGWLETRWRELGARLEAGECWHPPEKLKAVRLLGRLPHEVADESEVSQLYLCCHVLEPNDRDDPFAEVRSDMESNDYARLKRRLAKRNVESKRPPNAEVARAQLLELVRRNVDRLSALAARHRAFDEHMNARRADVMGFDDSMEGERLRRHMAASQRTICRAIGTIIKMRKELELQAYEPAADESPYWEIGNPEWKAGHAALPCDMGNEHPALPCDMGDRHSVLQCEPAQENTPEDGRPADAQEPTLGELQSKATADRDEPQVQGPADVHEAEDDAPAVVNPQSDPVDGHPTVERELGIEKRPSILGSSVGLINSSKLKNMVVKELERRALETSADDGFPVQSSKIEGRRRCSRRDRANKRGFRKPVTLEFGRAAPLLAPLPPVEFSQVVAQVHHQMSEELR
jgi:hypothetical protein